MPAPWLRPYVRRYVGIRYEGFASGVHPAVPNRYVSLIVNFAEPLEITALTRDGELSQGVFDAVAIGLIANPGTARHFGRLDALQIDLPPLAVQTLIGVPASALAWDTVNLRQVLGTAVLAEFQERGMSMSWPERFALADELLTRQLCDSAPQARDEVLWAWTRMQEHCGDIRIGSLAAEVGWTPRELRRRFVREFGLVPKVAGRVLRFERSRQLLRVLSTFNQPLLNKVAAHCGYFDQAHMAAEWRDLAGHPPMDFIEMLRACQQCPFFPAMRPQLAQ